MYKILIGDTIAGVIDAPIFVRYQLRNKKVVVCSKEQAQGILSPDGTTVFQMEGMDVIPGTKYEVATIIPIAEDEYQTLLKIFQENESVTPEGDRIDVVGKATLKLVRDAKIAQMSDICSKTIVDGVDVIFADGKTHHFDLTIEDQLNLITLKEMISMGCNEIPYHEKGGLCKMYSASDIATLIDVASKHKTYHLTYFNSLKNYIMNIGEVTAVDSVRYGMSIPEEYCSDILLEMLGGGE